MLARLAAVAAVLMVAGGSAEAGGYYTFDPDASGSTSFVMPSGNIGCIYTPAGGSTVYVPADGGPELSCDRVAPSYRRFVLSAGGKATMITNVGDPSCCGADNALPYGTAWRIEPFICTSETKGLTCARDDGHGFFISKAKVTTY